MSDSAAGATHDGRPSPASEQYAGPFTIHDAAPRPSMLRRTRAVIGKNATVDRVYKTGVGITGAGAVALGVILIPLPGPGSLIALGGLALLGTEFAGAKKVSGVANDAAKKAFAKAKEARRARRNPTTPNADSHTR